MSEGDYLAGWLAKQKQPPRGRVHLHAFIKRNSLTRCAVYEEGELERLPKRLRQSRAVWSPPKRTVLDGKLDWRVSTRASSVCKVPGRCVLADIVEAVPA